MSEKPLPSLSRGARDPPSGQRDGAQRQPLGDPQTLASSGSTGTHGQDLTFLPRLSPPANHSNNHDEIPPAPSNPFSM